MKKGRKNIRIICICILAIILFRLIFIVGYSYYPVWIITHTTKENKEIERWSHEYYDGEMWSAVNGAAYSFTKYSADKVSKWRYNKEYHCYITSHKLWKSYYNVTLNPSTKTISYNVFVVTLLDLLN